MATPLLIGANEKSALQALKLKAAESPVDMPKLARTIGDPAVKQRHMRQMTEQSLEIPFGFLVTFSYETGHPGGATRHLSLSSQRSNRVPTPEALMMIAHELGFVGDYKSWDRVWVENLLSHGRAINAIQLLT